MNTSTKAFVKFSSEKLFAIKLHARAEFCRREHEPTCTLVEKARCMLNDAKLRKEF